MTLILLEGRPGVGKTTVAARLADLLRERDVPVVGFLTHELRENGRRVGFEVESRDGRLATLAHVGFRGGSRVGKYGVDVAAFERVALPALASPPRDGIVVVDELGKMELFSEPFRDAISRLLDDDVTVVATVHVFSHPFTDALKARTGVELIDITRASRDELPRRLADRLVRETRGRRSR